MGWRWHSPEQIAAALADVRSARQNGAPLSLAIKAAGVSEATFFRWQALYGKLAAEEIAQLKQRGAESEWPVSAGANN